MNTISKFSVALIATWLSAAVNDSVHAADIIVSAFTPSRPVLTALFPLFERSTEHKVTVTYEAGAAMLAKVRSGAALDLMVVQAEPLDELVKEGKIAGGRSDIFISGIGLAVKAGAPKPDISSAAALTKTLLAAKSVAYSRGTSGVYFAGVLQRLGIADQMKAKLIVVEGRPVGTAAARDEAEIAVQQLTELLPVPGIDLVGPLPAELQARILYSAGVPVSAKQPEAAKALIKFFSSPAAAPVVKAHGLQQG